MVNNEAQQPEVELLRELGLHERYALSRYNVGFPVIVALAATLDQPISPLEAHLTQRIALLLDTIPLLSCHINGARTRTPRFARRLTPLVTAAEYLSVGAPTNLSNAELVRDEIGYASKRKVEGPLWHITLLPSTSSEQTTHLVLATNHVVVDGRGSANLLESLLSPTPLDQGRPTSLGLPERSDRILPMAPPLLYLLRVVFIELLLPRLPSFLSRPILPKASWPTDAPLPHKPFTRPCRLEGLSFPAETTALLKQVANENGVETLQPLLQMAAVTAAYVVARRDRVLLASGTPISVREKERDSFSSGNFVSLHEWECDVEPDTQIWGLAREYAEDISSPSGRQAALHVMGMLAHIPDSPSHVATPEAPTGWEAFFNAKKYSHRPYRSSFGISNLGLIRLLGARAKAVCWAQTPSPYGEALMLDTCCLAPELDAAEGGERGGITLCVSWRDACVPGEDFVKALKATLDLLVLEASEKKGMRKEFTMGDIAKTVRAKLESDGS